MSARRRRQQDQEHADDARLLRAWRKWHAEQLEEALAGAHGAMVADLMALLDKLELDSAAVLLALVERTDWTAVNYEVRLELLHQINDAVCRMRERHGLSPFDDGVPGDRSNLFQRIRGAVTGYASDD
jgi:hypothetical protein